MSSIISSFIEPVVRQARRFSANPAAAADTNDAGQDQYQPPDRAPSHASCLGDAEANLPLRRPCHEPMMAPTALPARSITPSLSQALLGRLAPFLSIAAQPSEADADPETDRTCAMSTPRTDEARPSSSSDRRGSRDEPALHLSPSLPLRYHSRDHALRALNRLAASTAGRRTPGSKAPEPLPENDGQQTLRQELLNIWRLDVTTEEKARRMHAVMNESYYASQPHMRPHTLPESSISPDKDGSPQYNVHESDLIPSYRPPSNTDPDGARGCVHYKRNVKVQCYACKTWWPCRCCHDEAQLGHELPRHLTENMLCMICLKPGPAGQYCQHCTASAAYYYCEICKLWDDSNQAIYHCVDCGICRRGEGIGKDYVHCKTCNVCLPIQYGEAHKCVERAAECDCPICGAYMFNSAETIVALPCGHYQHQTCYNEYMEVAYQCPVCKKSAVNMELHWRKLEDEIARQPMPSKWRGTVVEIRCNDCGGKSRCDYHWLGNRCGLCDSFNTVEMRIIKTDGPDDAERPVTQSRPERTGRHLVPQARARSYFSDPDEGGGGGDGQGEAAGEGELAFGFSNTAYEMLARMSRSLSPLRHYFEADGEEGEGRARLGPRGGPATEAEIEELGFWSDGTGQRSELGSDGEDEDEVEVGEEGSESEEDEDEDDDDDDDSDDEDSDGSLLNLTLIGHR